jgi:hypothetical protein
VPTQKLLGLLSKIVEIGHGRSWGFVA